MPTTKKQMRAAGRELRRRRSGEVQQERSRAQSTRPFGACSEENLRKYAQGIDREIEKIEGLLNESGSIEHGVWLLKAKQQKQDGR